jgi:DNA-binding MarR family transcriptional regulator
MSVASPDLARDAWVLMLRFFFAKARPRMLELWREFDLMPPQQMVLGLLEEPRSMGDLAQEMHCDNSNITGIVDRLEERGLVERRAAEGDRRVKLVALTEDGTRLRAELDRRRSVPPPQISALTDADLRRLHAIFSKAMAEEPVPGPLL